MRHDGHEVGDIYMEETDLLDTIGRVVSGMTIESVMMPIPDQISNRYVEDTGDVRPPSSLDMIAITFGLANGESQKVFLLLKEAKDLAVTLVDWHNDMHEAGKCGNHEG